MTTTEPNCPSAINSGADHEPDASDILNFIRSRDATTLEQVALRAEITEGLAETILRDLEAQDLVTVTARLHCVRVAATDTERDFNPPRTDGSTPDESTLHRLKNVLTTDTASLPISESELYKALSNDRRRGLIRLLAATTDGHHTDGACIELNDAARILASAETDGEPTDDDVHRCYVALMQQHAPLLDNLGLIDYHSKVQKIEPTEHIVLVERLLANNTSILAEADG